ncbi:kinesin-like protein KIN-UB [Carex rostrata]
MESIKKLEEKWKINQQFIEKTRAELEIPTETKSDELLEVRNMLENKKNLRQSSQDEIVDLRHQAQHWIHLASIYTNTLLCYIWVLQQEATYFVHVRQERLQALVRGHLVRKQAMATLRCMVDEA